MTIGSSAHGPQSLEGRRIGLLTASASRLGGGVSEVVVQQASMIRELGGEPLVFALDDAHAGEDRARYGACPVHFASPKGPRQIGFAPELVGELLAAKLDLLHLHGIWMYPSRAGAVWARKTGKPYVISPHGMLDPWITGRGRAKKAIARLGYEHASWRAARAFHALTAREAADIARETGRTESIVIPNAGPPLIPAGSKPRSPQFLYLGRIHPKKNIGALISAWSERADILGQLGARLTIAGWGDPADVAELRARLEATPPSIEFVGPLYGAAKQRAYTEARFFVLPSLSEGLPMVVLEAWAASTPVLMTTECNLPEGFAAGAAIDCGFDAMQIGAALDRAMSMGDAEWTGMADAGRRLAQTSFSAGFVAGRWEHEYGALLQAAPAQEVAL